MHAFVAGRAAALRGGGLTRAWLRCREEFCTLCLDELGVLVVATDALEQIRNYAWLMHVDG